MVEGTGCSIILYRIEPGTRFDLHSHQFVELGVILGGRGRMRIGKGERELREGDSFYLPSGTVHGFATEGNKPAVIMDVTVPLPSDLSGSVSSSVLAIAKEVARAPAAPGIGGRSGRGDSRKPKIESR
jgi:quercetin dioxygenase-like cupin family protein